MTTLTTDHSPKMMREALCFAERAVARWIPEIPTAQANITGHVLADLIRECDRNRPLGPDGTHGDRHTLLRVRGPAGGSAAAHAMVARGRP